MPSSGFGLVFVEGDELVPNQVGPQLVRITCSHFNYNLFGCVLNNRDQVGQVVVSLHSLRIAQSGTLQNLSELVNTVHKIHINSEFISKHSKM